MGQWSSATFHVTLAAARCDAFCELMQFEDLQLVVLSGLIWDFPASCAWAARVYVNDR